MATKKLGYVESLADLRTIYRAVHQSREPIAIDLETTGLDPHTDSILLVAMCTEEECWVIPDNHAGADAEWQKALAETIQHATRNGWIAHNSSFEYRFIYKRYGLRLDRGGYDTQLAEAILTAGYFSPINLGDTAKRRLGLSLDKGLQRSFIGVAPATFVATPEQVRYAADDVAFLHELRRVQLDLLTTKDLLPVLDLELRALPVFADMELNGIYLDTAKHEEVLRKYREDEETYGSLAQSALDGYWQTYAKKEGEYNRVEYEKYVQVVAERRYNKKSNPEGDLQPGSEELKSLYKERDKWKPKPITALRLSSRAEVLAALAMAGIELPDLKKQTVTANHHTHPALAAYSQWATARKVVSTYGDSLVARVNPATGRVHPSYNQLVSTGRTSSRGPNGQNMPPAIRACFTTSTTATTSPSTDVAGEERVLVVVDASNMELRIAADRYKDRAMIDAFLSGKDLHRMTAAAAWPELYRDWQDVPKDSSPKSHRSLGKTGNFLTIYGGTAEAAVYRGVFPDLATGQRVQEAIQRLYPQLWTGIWAEGPRALRNLYATTNMGRKRFFRGLGPEPPYSERDEWKEWKKRRKGIMRQAMNHGIQGTGADIMKLTGVLLRQRLISRRWYEEVKLVAHVHDEWVLESPASLAGAVESLVLQTFMDAAHEYVPSIPIPGDAHVVESWEK